MCESSQIEDYHKYLNYSSTAIIIKIEVVGLGWIQIYQVL